MRKWIPKVVERAVHIANHPKVLITVLLSTWFICSMTYMVFENRWSPVNSLWWGIVTASTVGYGDFFPKTLPGRIAGGTLIVSFVFFYIPLVTAAIIAHLMKDPDAWTHEEQQAALANIENICHKLDIMPVEVKG